ncbi:GRASP55/65 PDZ-like domain-containing protein [Aspergillus coremiiformis]|uniref:GRASP55/65 PDZ-like domain-containing protein n=1 Tax=Aspergillus coremiiformis TaxID=138285 RepID=A0A5N6ZGZ8_9EURO|nr:GRASP55/65 PDZ-like domain-containing protein [Aspergillus coremiiformis]
MFGALNRFIGRLDSEPVQQPRATTNDNAFGFQVLRNKDPELPLEPWFDFIVGINGRLIDDPDPNLFATEVRNCTGSSVTFEVWSAKGQKTHTVSLPISPANPTLGLALQLAPLSSTQHIWHVLNIPSPLSPAYRAGLLPHSDYIIGTPSGTLRGESALGELVEDHLDRTLVLWVYSSEFDVVREVELVPTRGWGGEGAVGAELGYGALHRLPVGLGEEVEGPGEVVFETRDDGLSTTVLDPMNSTQGIAPGPTGGGHFLVPANMAVPPPPVASQSRQSLSASPAPGQLPATRRGKSRHYAVAPNQAFDEYFAEGEQKSKEEDFAPSRKGTPLPPPPKGIRSPPPAGSPAPATEQGSG